jgi:hypothetical protein
MLARLSFLTAGESHGPALTGLLDGVPAGVPLAPADLALQLRRRRHGHGRSPRQQLEHDVVAVEERSGWPLRASSEHRRRQRRHRRSAISRCAGAGRRRR